MTTKTHTKDSFTIVLIWTVRLAWLISILVMLMVMSDYFTQSPFKPRYFLSWIFILGATIGMHGLIKILAELKT
ncbi:hypothetical protein [Gilvimarinus sp. DA14]|uniref:hypothetical protein n=1 Tax=Gilvimarinus sp. DA14 TaxID=2956798 RepID=UPI0020B6D5FF|nr:hypothetical protein [Gilvimarinus sp. DA14]UTF59005.1 hypothetical protein NHM04_11005 [Gilvimarinus sp. DA14]